jgi:hypothetical protein
MTGTGFIIVPRDLFKDPLLQHAVSTHGSGWLRKPLGHLRA